MFRKPQYNIFISKTFFPALICLQLHLVISDDDSGKSREPTIHQLGARSIIKDLEQQMEEDNTFDLNGKEYIAKLIGEVSRSARIPSKYTSLVSIDDKCEEGQALCIRRYDKNKG